MIHDEADMPGASDAPVVVPIEDSLDLHGFQPRDVLDVVDAYLDAARERGFCEVRLIHGRGKGVQRAQIRQWLAADPRVARSEEAPAGRGGWGATLVWLHAPDDVVATPDPTSAGDASARDRAGPTEPK